MVSLLHHLLARAAAERPDAVAVVDGERSLTYAQLDEQANRLAHALRAAGVGRGDRVGLWLEKSAEAVVGIHAVLKAGAAYVPLDPQSPATRVGYIAGDCGIRCLLSSTERAAAWRDLQAAGAGLETIFVLDAPEAPAEQVPEGVRALGAAALDGHPGTAPADVGIDLDLAYILYTSGSTGAPKGVKLSHLHALRFVEWAAGEFVRGPGERLSSHAPFHFDLSIFDLFASAFAAATVVLVPPSTSFFPAEVRRFIQRHEITVWYSVPSVLSMLALRGGLRDERLPALHTILFAGEMFPTPYLRQLMERLPGVRFANLYGPTETNVCTWYEVPQLDEDDTRTIPIGRAIDNVEVFAWTDGGRVAEVGEVGELYVRGATVMLGYWGDAERSARSLVADPRDPERPDRAYRTGDLVSQDPDGNYRFVGRRDTQIKSRGYRIELGEIEAALYAHPGVAECGVVAVPDELVTNRVKAFVVVRDETDAAQLARFCAERLPHYMVPEQWELADHLPKTSTGKLDRQALLGRR